MESGSRVWSWWLQVFMELWNGLTDAFREIFTSWWWAVRGSFTGDKDFWDKAQTFLMHGVNPVNLFQTEVFYKFRAAVIFWRFMLAFWFAVTRSISMINM